MKRILFLIIGIVVLMSASMKAAEANTITLTDIADGRVFQRSSGTADITISGTYTGSPVNIEYRIVNDGTNDPVSGHDWQTLENSPTGGTFSGTASTIPEGGWYNVDVRFSNDAGITYQGTTQWGVGILVGIIGQSNASNWFDTGTDETANPLLRKYAGGTWSTMVSTGNGAIAFGNHIITNLTTAVPVGLLDYAVGATALRTEADSGPGYWENYGSAPYSTFKTAVTAVGGALEYIVWVQGETDARSEVVSETEYETSLTSFIAQVRADVGNGSAESNLPFLVSLLGRGTYAGDDDDDFQAIRNAQEDVVATGSDLYIASTTTDLALADTIHYTDAAYSIHGKRCAQTILYILGEETYHRGPYISSGVAVNAIHTDVTITHRGGSDFNPVSGITGFEIADDGAWETPSAATHIDATTIRLTHTPFNGTRTVRYLYGADPTVTDPAVDNAALTLPLEDLDGRAVTQLQLGGCDVDPDPAVFTYFQAKDATFASPTNFSEVGGELFGKITQITHPPVDPPAEYSLNFLEAGTYYVWLLARSPEGSGGDNSAWYGFDGVVMGNISVQEILPDVFPTYKHWINQRWNDGPQYAQINIPTPGTYVFNLWSMVPGVEIDAVGLTKSLDVDFNTPPPSWYVLPNICSFPDKDGDGMDHNWESSHGLDPYDPSDAYYDNDGDGLNNLGEYNLGTDPQNPDTDNDGVLDGFDGYPLDNQLSSCLDPIKNDSGLFLGIYTTVQAAVDDPNAVDHDTIQITVADFDEDILYDRNIILTLSGGWYCDFFNNPSTSSINSLTIRNGTIIVENLVIY